MEDCHRFCSVTCACVFFFLDVVIACCLFRAPFTLHFLILVVFSTSSLIDALKQTTGWGKSKAVEFWYQMISHGIVESSGTVKKIHLNVGDTRLK